MEDIADIRELAKSLSKDLEKGAVNDAQKIASEWAENFKEHGGAIEDIAIKQLPDGSFDVTGKRAGNDVNFNTKQLDTDLNGSIDDAGKATDPNITRALESLGFTKSDFKEGDWDKINETAIDSFRNGDYYKLNERFEKFKKDMNGRPDPQDKNDFERQTKNNMDEIKKRLEKMGDKGGEWVKTSLKYLLAGFGAFELYNAITQHQNKMNGCWLIDSKTGHKCKINTLTCNSECNDECTPASPSSSSSSSSDDCSQCVICKKFMKSPQSSPQSPPQCGSGSSSGPQWNPCPPHFAKCPSPSTPPYGPPPAWSTKTKLGCSSNKKDIPGDYNPETDISNSCSSGCPCITKELACPDTSKSCSDFCQTQNFALPSTFSLRCVNVSFWEAGNDFLQGGFGDIFGGIGAIVKKVLIIIVIVIGGLIGFAILVGLIKLIYSWIKNRKT